VRDGRTPLGREWKGLYVADGLNPPQGVPSNRREDTTLRAKAGEERELMAWPPLI